MSPERYAAIRKIFNQALELDPVRQAEFLEEACHGDAELKAEVLSLIDHDGRSCGFLETPAVPAPAVSFRLQPGTRLGTYEILEPIGAGAMGEVYRAFDSRFGRDVAVKLLPAAFAHDAERLARFQSEARAAGSLNHPNVVIVHDFGREGDSSYLVSEFLRGATLRDRLEKSAISPSAAVNYAAQIARGLGAAHSAGIVHRDLKPENLFLTRGGVIKILDFGLAKLPDLPASPPANATQPGVVLGSLGYLSPEQIRGEAAGPRSDIFSLGIILFEMLAGKRPFAGETWIAEIDAIARQEAPDLPANLAGTPHRVALNSIVKRCLAKQPEERFESARDMAFTLESLLERAVASPPGKRIPRAAIAAAALFLAAAAVFAFFRYRAPPPVEFQPLTFRRGIVSAARFADTKTIVYSAAWDGDDFGLYETRLGSPESRALGHSGAMLFAVSAKNRDLALCFRNATTQHGVTGRLAQAPLSGGGLHERADNIAAADWSPDGSQLAVVRVENEHSQIEYPIGRVLHRSRFSSGHVDGLRVSPRGDEIAFLDHPLQDDSAGSIALIDLGGNVRTISGRFNSMRGLAWSADGSELWFAAARQGTNMALWATNRSGRERVIAHFPSYVSVEDISSDGRALLSFHSLSESLIYSSAPADRRDLYWHDQSQVRDISRDGKTLLFSESGNATQLDYEAYKRSADGSSPATHLGTGLPLALSPNARWVIANPAGSPAPLVLMPTGQGESRPLAGGGIHHIAAAWLPDGNNFVFAGSKPGEQLRYYSQSLGGGDPEPITPAIHHERRSPIVVSPDGRFVAAVGLDRRILIYPTVPGEPAAVPGLEPGFTPLAWCRGDRLVLHRYDELPPRLWKADVRTGKLTLWTDVNPPSLVGLLDLTPIRVSPDCLSYAYSPLNVLSQVFLITGLR